MERKTSLIVYLCAYHEQKHKNFDFLKSSYRKNKVLAFGIAALRHVIEICIKLSCVIISRKMNKRE